MKFTPSRRGPRNGFNAETETMELTVDAAKSKGDVILSLDLIGHNGLQITFTSEQWEIFLFHANSVVTK